MNSAPTTEDGIPPGSTPPAQTACRHCGTPFRATDTRPEFCCEGCEFVFHLIRNNDLEKFYELRGGTRVAPVKPMVFQQRAYTWIEELVAKAEAGGGPSASVELELQGISCIGCVWLIERFAARMPGILDARVHPALGRLRLSWDPGRFDAPALARQLQSFGYLLGPAGGDGRGRLPGGALVVRIGLCAAAALNTMLFTLPRYLGMRPDFEFAPLFGWLAAGFASLSFLIGGSHFMSRSWQGLRRGALHIDLPIALGLTAAFIGSWIAWFTGREGFLYFDFVSVFTVLMLTGRWLQEKAVAENRRVLLNAQLGPSNLRLDDGAPVAAADLRSDAVYSVPPGEPIPVRSRLLSDAASLAMDWISGESDVRAVASGQLVPSGAVNASRSPVRLEALEAWTDSILAALLQTVPREPARYQPLERFIRFYTVAVLLVAACGFASWWLLAGDAATGLQVLVSVLVVSCPCASGVALPLLDEFAASGLRRFGVFVRDSAIWARLRRVRRIAFDKTGTLTEENLSLENPAPLRALDPEARGALLRLVSESWHPVCDCLRRELLAGGPPAQPVLEGAVAEHPGHGLTLESPAGTWRLGRPGWKGKPAPDPPNPTADCDFSIGDQILASFRFRDALREDADDEVRALRRMGLRLHILSGDRPEKIRPIAARLGFSEGEWHARLSPAEKADWIRLNGPQDTLMLGDGANDSLAFNASLCCGTPAIDRGLLEQKADFYYLGRGVSGVRHLLETARRRDRTAHRVIAFAVAYNIAVVAVSLAGRMNPLVAAILMPLSSLASLGLVYLGNRIESSPRGHASRGSTPAESNPNAPANNSPVLTRKLR